MTDKQTSTLQSYVDQVCSYETARFKDLKLISFLRPPASLSLLSVP
jgi:uncharacterized UPF0146 family protein